MAEEGEVAFVELNSLRPRTVSLFDDQPTVYRRGRERIRKLSREGTVRYSGRLQRSPSPNHSPRRVKHHVGEYKRSIRTLDKQLESNDVRQTKHISDADSKSEQAIVLNFFYDQLAEAARAGDHSRLTLLLDECATVVGSVPVRTLLKRTNERPLLHEACGAEVTGVLVRMGVDVNCRNSKGLTALEVAQLRGDTIQADILLHYGADPRIHTSPFPVLQDLRSNATVVHSEPRIIQRTKSHTDTVLNRMAAMAGITGKLSVLPSVKSFWSAPPRIYSQSHAHSNPNLPGIPHPQTGGVSGPSAAEKRKLFDEKLRANMERLSPRAKRPSVDEASAREVGTVARGSLKLKRKHRRRTSLPDLRWPEHVAPTTVPLAVPSPIPVEQRTISGRIRTDTVPLRRRAIDRLDSWADEGELERPDESSTIPKETHPTESLIPGGPFTSSPTIRKPRLYRSQTAPMLHVDLPPSRRPLPSEDYESESESSISDSKPENMLKSDFIGDNINSVSNSKPEISKSDSIDDNINPAFDPKQVLLKSDYKPDICESYVSGSLVEISSSQTETSTPDSDVLHSEIDILQSDVNVESFDNLSGDVIRADSIRSETDTKLPGYIRTNDSDISSHSTSSGVHINPPSDDRVSVDQAGIQPKETTQDEIMSKPSVVIEGPLVIPGSSQTISVDLSGDVLPWDQSDRSNVPEVFGPGMVKIDSPSIPLTQTKYRPITEISADKISDLPAKHDYELDTSINVATQDKQPPTLEQPSPPEFDRVQKHIKSRKQQTVPPGKPTPPEVDRVHKPVKFRKQQTVPPGKPTPPEVDRVRKPVKSHKNRKKRSKKLPRKDLKESQRASVKKRLTVRSKSPNPRAKSPQHSRRSKKEPVSVDLQAGITQGSYAGKHPSVPTANQNNSTDVSKQSTGNRQTGVTSSLKPESKVGGKQSSVSTTKKTPRDMTLKKPARQMGDLKVRSQKLKHIVPTQETSSGQIRTSTPKKSPTSKPETPKIFEPKQVATLKVTTSKVSTPKVSTPKVATPKVSAPKVVTPKVATPKVVTPKITSPQSVIPKVTTPKKTISKTPTVFTPVNVSPEKTSPDVKTPEITETALKVPKPVSSKPRKSQISLKSHAKRVSAALGVMQPQDRRKTKSTVAPPRTRTSKSPFEILAARQARNLHVRARDARKTAKLTAKEKDLEKLLSESPKVSALDKLESASRASRDSNLDFLQTLETDTLEERLLAVERRKRKPRKKVTPARRVSTRGSGRSEGTTQSLSLSDEQKLVLGKMYDRMDTTGTDQIKMHDVAIFMKFIDPEGSSLEQQNEARILFTALTDIQTKIRPWTPSDSVDRKDTRLRRLATGADRIPRTNTVGERAAANIRPQTPVMTRALRRVRERAMVNVFRDTRKKKHRTKGRKGKRTNWRGSLNIGQSKILRTIEEIRFAAEGVKVVPKFANTRKMALSPIVRAMSRSTAPSTPDCRMALSRLEWLSSWSRMTCSGGFRPLDDLIQRFLVAEERNRFLMQVEFSLRDPAGLDDLPSTYFDSDVCDEMRWELTPARLRGFEPVSRKFIVHGSGIPPS
eukprot:927535_1